MRTVLLAALTVTAVAPSVAQVATPPATVQSAIADSRRSEANRARDPYRHPAETLAFFGVRPGQTVVEFIPSGGWYAEILAPLQKGRGRYVALVPAAQAERTTKMLADKRDWFGETSVAKLDASAGTSTLPAASADVILTFRNVHNLVMGDKAASAPNVFKAFYAALKPGGTLGVVDHRLPEPMATSLQEKSGYIKQSTVVKLATDAGFRLDAESAVNANPKDTHDHPQGVWTLPPSYVLKDQDRAKYQAIGESDRMTLRFVKPKG